MKFGAWGEINFFRKWFSDYRVVGIMLPKRIYCLCPKRSLLIVDLLREWHLGYILEEVFKGGRCYCAQSI